MDGARPTDSISPRLSHVVYTRFNLDSHEQKEGLATWTLRRLELFKQFCLPSIVNQSSQDFQWVIFYDKRSLPELRQQLIESTSSHSHIHWTACAGNAEYAQSGRNTLLSYMNEHSDFFISTRLDNDDALHKDYIQEVQNIARQRQQLCAINFLNGQILDVRQNPILLDDSQKSNPFISLIAPVNGNETMCAINNKHKSWAAKDYYLNINNDTAKWLQIIHGGNVSNVARGKKVHSVESVADFGIDMQQLEIHMPKSNNNFWSKTKSWLSTAFSKD